MLRLRQASAHLRRLVAPHPSSPPPAPSVGGGITGSIADLRRGPSSWSGETHLRRLVNQPSASSGCFTAGIAELRRGFSSWSEHTHLRRAVHQQQRPYSSPSAASGGFTGRIADLRRGISSWSGGPNLPCPCCGRSLPEVTADHLARGSTHVIYDTPKILIPERKVILPTEMMLELDSPQPQPYHLNYEAPITHFKKQPLLLKDHRHLTERRQSVFCFSMCSPSCYHTFLRSHMMIVSNMASRKTSTVGVLMSFLLEQAHASLDRCSILRVPLMLSRVSMEAYICMFGFLSNLLVL